MRKQNLRLRELLGEVPKSFLLCLFLPTISFSLCLQLVDHDPPDHDRENGLPKSDLYTPPVKNIQVTDIFYEDTVTSAPLKTITYPETVFASLPPGQI